MLETGNGISSAVLKSSKVSNPKETFGAGLATLPQQVKGIEWETTHLRNRNVKTSTKKMFGLRSVAHLKLFRSLQCLSKEQAQHHLRVQGGFTQAGHILHLHCYSGLVIKLLWSIYVFHRKKCDRESVGLGKRMMHFEQLLFACWFPVDSHLLLLFNPESQSLCSRGLLKHVLLSQVRGI